MGQGWVKKSPSQPARSRVGSNPQTPLVHDSDGNEPSFLGLGSGRAFKFWVGSGSGWPECTVSGHIKVQFSYKIYPKIFRGQKSINLKPFYTQGNLSGNLS